MKGRGKKCIKALTDITQIKYNISYNTFITQYVIYITYNKN